MEAMQSTFRCTVEKGSLAASPNIGHTFQNFSVITERLADAKEIDGEDLFAPIPDMQQRLLEGDFIDGSEDSDSDAEDIIWLIHLDGGSSRAANRVLSIHPPPSETLKGCEYAQFKPKDIPRELCGHT
jgi:hypothetical protein